jgi:hypothetical protein
MNRIIVFIVCVAHQESTFLKKALHGAPMRPVSKLLLLLVVVVVASISISELVL